MNPQETIKRLRERASLQRKWYKVLLSQGFQDIETFDRNMEPHLHLSVKNGSMKYIDEIGLDLTTSVEVQGILDYYSSAGDMLHQDTGLQWGVFATEKDKELWSHHCEGLSLREISARVGVSKSTVSNRLNKYTSLMTSECSV